MQTSIDQLSSASDKLHPLAFGLLCALNVAGAVIVVALWLTDLRLSSSYEFEILLLLQLVPLALTVVSTAALLVVPRKRVGAPSWYGLLVSVVPICLLLGLYVVFDLSLAVLELFGD